MTLGEVIWLSVLGMAIVLVVLVLMMAAVGLMPGIIRAFEKRSGAEKTGDIPDSSAFRPLRAAGSTGVVSLFDVPDKTAAMIMAIVADELDAPLNELRFISIKEVEGKSDEI